LYRLPDAWMWDFWLADDGEHYHLFFLYASRALNDPEARHLRASIGHAISTDLTNWRRTDDALVRSDPPAFDDVATWTGSIGKHPDGTWFLFYTGGSRTGSRLAQTIGYATSSDLISWTKNPGNPVVKADPRWYEALASRPQGDDSFRDPWVFRRPRRKRLAHADHCARDHRSQRRPRHRRTCLVSRPTRLAPPPPTERSEPELQPIGGHLGRAHRWASDLAVLLPRGRHRGSTAGNRRLQRRVGGHRSLPARSVRHRQRSTSHRRVVVQRSNNPASQHQSMEPARIPQQFRHRRIRRHHLRPASHPLGRPAAHARTSFNDGRGRTRWCRRRRAASRDSGGRRGRRRARARPATRRQRRGRG